MKKLTLLLTIILFSIGSSNVLLGQNGQESITKTIITKDSLFWAGYNTCNIGQMQQLVSDDVEFYHDKGGVTLGAKDLMESLQKNICGNVNNKIRREAVEGTVKVFPLKNGETIYGAIISGEHYFYVKEKDKNERLDGLAKFTQLWILRDNTWKMTRILSFDHGPAPYINKRQSMKLTDNILNQFVGQYIFPKSGSCNVQKSDDGLTLLIEGQKYIVYPESENLFFTKDRNLTFEFVKNDKGEMSKIVVRENGLVVEEAVYQK